MNSSGPRKALRALYGLAGPELLVHVKVRVDKDRQANGRYVLTGSQRFPVMQAVNESLAGRVALLELLPFGLDEHPVERLEDAIWNGGYPDPALGRVPRDLWMRSYIQTYLERDVRQVVNVRDLRAFESFLASCAAHHGQEFNMASVSRDCGVSIPTVRAWTGVLEASYVTFMLPPYFRNLGKRLVRTSKLVFLDPAIAATLTRQPSADAAIAGSMGGALFEGFVVAEAVKAFAARGLRPDLWFWRSHDGLEVDLIVQASGLLCPIEIKLTATPTSRHTEPMDRFKALAGPLAAPGGVLVCRVAEPHPLGNGNTALPWQAFPAWLAGRLDGRVRPLE